MRTPWGLHEDSTRTPRGLHGNPWGTVKYSPPPPPPPPLLLTQLPFSAPALTPAPSPPFPSFAISFSGTSSDPATMFKAI